MANLDFYDKVRRVPKEAQKTIVGGRLKNFTDINPMWRIKIMTDVYGPCGIGWKYEICKQWVEAYGSEIKVFCNINLYIKVDNVWSDAIPGTGGSYAVAVEKQGLYVSDEGYKMALTDALSVAMKSLGVGADIYWDKDRDFETKYSPKPEEPTQKKDDVALLLPDILAQIKKCSSVEELTAIHKKNPMFHQETAFMSALTKRKHEINGNS